MSTGRDARFLGDAMLGDVVRWLRLMGFDVTFAGGDEADDRILERAGAEERWLVTRDAAMEGPARRLGVHLVRLTTRDLEEALTHVLRAAQAPVERERWFTRCTRCNGPLSRAEAAKVDVPQRVRAAHAEFWRCNGCGQVYWEGTHVSKIRERLESVQRRLEGSPR